MEDKTLMIIVLLISELISLFLLVKLFKSQTSLLYKLIMTVIVLLPVIGPVLFIFIHNMPDKMPLESRATMNHYGNGGKFIGSGSSRYNYDIVQDGDDQNISNESRKKKPKKKKKRKK